ncbi:MAG: deoxyribonuclease V [Chloroflexota bacterium]
MGRRAGMMVRDLHDWRINPEEAREVQRRLAGLVSRHSEVGTTRVVAGVDASYPRWRGVGTGSVVLVRYPDLTLLEVRTYSAEFSFPYIPGLLSFRESPLVLGAWKRLSSLPDLVLVDGQGIAHPRRMGLASHLGLLLDRPTIGCAKSVLCGTHGPVGEGRGSWVELVDGGEVIGAAVRTKERATPVYVSIGHKVDLPSALHWTQACCRGYRLPEPLRLAHLASVGELPATKSVRH